MQSPANWNNVSPMSESIEGQTKLASFWSCAVRAHFRHRPDRSRNKIYKYQHAMKNCHFLFIVGRGL